jgi:hypothetical protein
MPTPFYSAYDAVSFPWGTFVRPGGNVVAYVRSTGAQSGDDAFASSGMLVSTIAAGVARCRPGMDDIVGVLPNHTETVTTTLFTPVAGAQIIGCGRPGSSNAPNITLSATAATIALSSANMTLAGLNINSATAAVTGAIVVTGAGCTLANNFISFTGALAANVAIQVTGAANFSLVENTIVASTTGAIVGVTAAGSSNFLIRKNLIRQLTSGSYITVANTAGISGDIADNYCKSVGATPAAGAGIVISIITTVSNTNNFTQANAVTAPVAATGS